MLQDKSGFMWFGTKDGLNRYDGISIKVFKGEGDHVNGLKHTFITTLFEEDSGTIWIGTDIGVYTYNPYKEHFEHFLIGTKDGKQIDKTINKIGKAPNGKMLFAVDGLGLFLYDNAENKLHNHPFPNLGSVREFQVDPNGNRIWIAFYKGLYYTDDEFQTLLPYRFSDGTEPFKEESITALYFGGSDRAYIGSEKNGMIGLDMKAQTVHKVPLSRRPNTPIFVRCLYPYSDRELWIGTETGIYIYDVITQSCTHLQNTKSDPSSISDNAIYSLYKDREGGMWIGSYFGGVNYYPKQNTYFEKYYPTNDIKTLQGQRVREICKGKDHDLWIGTEDVGLFRFNSQTKEFKHFSASSGFSNIHGLCMDGDDLWVGTFSKGLRVINTNTGAMRVYTADNAPHSLPDNYVFSILKSSKGDIYLGTSLSLVKYDRQRDVFEKIPQLDQNLVYDIKEDTKGNIWVATYTNGVYRYDVNRDRWEHFQQSDKKGSLPYNKVLSIFEDSKKQIWLTTEGQGFCKYEESTHTFKHYKNNGNLNYGVVYQIIEDDRGFFWLTTNKGLIRFDPSSSATKTYTVASGLLSDQFNYKSSYKTNDGNILLGGINGMIAFNPSTFTENDYIPPVYVTDFLLFGRAPVIGGQNSPLKKSILYSDSIVLNHDQNHFSLRIAALSFQAPQVNSLQYKLEGIGEDWQNMTESSLINYSNLRSGKYLFRVRGANNDGLWNLEERTLHITVLPPFYLTIWAYALYLLIVVLLVFLVIRFFKNRQAQRHKWIVQELEQGKERELHEAKLNFFTNITHEIRTPLTLIKGPLENIMTKDAIKDQDTIEDMRLMKQNTDRLLELTDQLLDFRKTEKEGFLLKLSTYDIPAVLEELYRSFAPLIKENDRQFILDLKDARFSAFIDKDAFVKIVGNLFTNAIKYAEKHIAVTLHKTTNGDTFEVEVKSDGRIIAEEYREKIFEPFTRLDHIHQSRVPGTGIGMYLARTLAELHNGRLVLRTTETENIFSLTIPIAPVSLPSADHIAEGRQDDIRENEIEPSDRLHTILLVEDNVDMLRFVKKILPKDYHVLVASNGEDALSQLKNKFVSLVISDIMMPGMSGVELCQLIKSDINYSHIPVILLTAKTTIQSKIEGIGVGADAYIDKPFSPDYLLAIVNNLINNREKLKETFMKNPLVLSNTMVSNEADKEFLTGLTEVIHRNMSNADLKMEDVAVSMNMSRASFYRKIKGLLDLKPNEYLRLERLKMAARLIKENRHPIGEVCYIVGFNSPSYFAKCFHEQFGVLPKDYQ